MNLIIWHFRGQFWSFLLQQWIRSEKWVVCRRATKNSSSKTQTPRVRMEVLGGFRQSLYHLGADAVGALQQGAPPGLDNILLNVSSWGDPSQVFHWLFYLYPFTFMSILRVSFSTSQSSLPSATTGAWPSSAPSCSVNGRIWFSFHIAEISVTII